MHVLARRGLTMLKAKRAVEAMLQDGAATVELPVVEDPDTVTRELAAAGLQAMPMVPVQGSELRAGRNRLGLTRQQFALRYGLEVEAVKNWETGKREPDTAARSYLRAIFNDPKRVEEAYARAPSP